MQSLNKNSHFNLPTLSALIATTVFLTGCANKPVSTTNQSSTIPVQIKVNQQGIPSHYKVRRGDTLSQIANFYGLDYKRIAAINHLDSRYTIYAGQWIKLYDDTGSNNDPTFSRSGNNSAQYNSYNSNQSAVHTRNQPTYRPPMSAAATTAPITANVYLYPSSNNVIQNFNSTTGSLGMWFAGNEGDPVLASSNGVVLYAGDGLPEYGNLVLIRHDDNNITAYAHNKQILVKEGENVQTGQRIATMGNTGNTNQVALEFQFRKNGQPIDPLLILKH